MVFAVNDTFNPNFSPTDTNNLVIQEGLKTRNDLKAYFDQKFDKWLDEATIKAQGFLDDNVAQIDQTIKSEVSKYYIKIIIGFVASIFFSAMLIYFVILSVRRLLRKKSVHEREVIMAWLEAHEKEQVAINESIKELHDFVEWLKGMKQTKVKPDEEILREVSP